jgi:alanyl-tRNA synthetase
MKSGIVLVGGAEGPRVTLVLGVTRDLAGKYRAGDLIKEVAAVVGGKGGGRADFAQAGGNDPERLDEALKRIFELV